VIAQILSPARVSTISPLARSTAAASHVKETQPTSASQARSVFGAASTAAEVIDGVDLRGRRAVVTGASPGIGVETVRALATVGADVTLAVRNTGTGAAVADQLRAELPSESGKLSAAQLELSDLSSVKAFAAAWDGPPHILVNNAGVMSPPDIARTAEGRE
jgi:hypothetical protein